MGLKKVIDPCKIGTEYQGFVDQFLLRVSQNFKEEIHSIYICGSIPKGQAKLNRSDADFTIVTNGIISNEQKDEVTSIKIDLLKAYPFVSKIDTTIISVDEVKSKPLEWGFWIKIISHCLCGEDLGKEVPELIGNSELILNLSSDVEESLGRLKKKLAYTEDETELLKTLRVYSKRLIRGLYTTILDEVGEWHDDIEDMKKALLLHLKEAPELVNRLYAFYRGIENKKSDFEPLAAQASALIFLRLEELRTCLEG